ncbi:hypothetical protein LAZ67_1003061 [Cordylochernes scorpioides]|uniref:Cathepsin L n=1 Tax=Cordylochernes scorpioides TaxID=51811 RepID=A0ABY6JZC4_9ARAC|nr:hypothetical protein LAZ67_1003061 [Cordylochernes scorpioides]
MLMPHAMSTRLPWAYFSALHNKNYHGEEDQVRKAIFEENMKKIVQHNLEYDLGIHSYYLGINKYSDMSQQEIIKKMTGLLPSYNHKSDLYVPSEDMELPSSVDWRSKGYVTGIKDQGKTCGSCWAFSAIGSLEGQHFRKSGKLVSLSEQNLLDCSKDGTNDGCDGGHMRDAFHYVMKNGGIDTEESYPYKGITNFTCAFNKNNIGATCKGYMAVTPNEKSLQRAVAEVGPIAAAIDAFSFKFHNYKGGIYDDPGCANDYYDHGIVVVGYGTEDGKDFWLVKNRIIRNKDNRCSIASLASYPICNSAFASPKPEWRRGAVTSSLKNLGSAGPDESTL